MKELYELKGEGSSIRGISRELGISRNTVRRYVRSAGVPKAKPPPEAGIQAGPIHGAHRWTDVGGAGQLRSVAARDQGVGIRRQLSDADQLRAASAPTASAPCDDAVRDGAW